MAVRALVIFPDARLHVPAQPVTLFDGELRALAEDLRDTMRAAPGIGITAPHIGALLRLVVIELPDAGGLRVYVNPHVAWSSDARLRHVEGSVSMPGVTETIERAARVRVTYQDLDGSERVEDAEGLLAVCHQHEIDQLDGIFWLDRLSRLKRERAVKRYRRQAARA